MIWRKTRPQTSRLSLGVLFPIYSERVPVRTSPGTGCLSPGNSLDTFQPLGSCLSREAGVYLSTGHEIGQAPSMARVAGGRRAAGARPPPQASQVEKWGGRAVRSRRVEWQWRLWWRSRPLCSGSASAAEAGRARGELLAHFTDLHHHPRCHRAQPPPRYHPHQTPVRRPQARVGAEPARGAGIPPRGPPPATPPGRSLPPAPRAPPSRPPANCVPPGPARSHMPPQGMPGLAGGGRALGRAGLGRAGQGAPRREGW